MQLIVNFVLFLLPAAGAGSISRSIARTSRDEWQLLAWVPTLPLAIWGVIIALNVTVDPTSHNLWPFELVIWGGLSGILFVAVLLGRRIMGGRSES